MSILNPGVREVSVTGSNAADGQANEDTPATGIMVWDGTAWNRARGLTSGVLLASAARTATTDTAIQTNVNARGVALILNVASSPAGETLTVNLYYVGEDGMNTNAVTFQTTVADINTRYTLMVGPGSTTTTGSYNKAVSLGLPRRWRARVTHGSANSWTYSLEYHYLM